MELSYWQSKWRKGNTGFHMKEGYPGLKEHWNSVQIKDNAAVLVPLCGKTKDLLFLSQQCRRVIGVEISEMAVREFLKENNLEAEKFSFADFSVYQAKNIEIWQGDFFKLPKHKLPRLDLIYDKAALIALPPEMRANYAEQILEFTTSQTKILLHLFDYPQEEMNGPPFSVSIEEINNYFGKRFSIGILEEKNLNLNNYEKFQNRGLHSHFIEILLLLLPKVG